MTTARAVLVGLMLPAALHAQKADLPKCGSDDVQGKVTKFEVTLPLPVTKAYGRVVRAFTMIGLSPSNATTLTNQVQWSSGTETNFLTGDNRARQITATLIEDDVDENKTLVVIAPFEGTTEGYTKEQHLLPLSNKNAGYGKKVWCAARTISDSLKATAVRLAERQAAAPADTTKAVEIPAAADTAAKQR